MSRFSARPPAAATVLVDDANTRTTRWDFEPGAATTWHRHALDYVVITLTECLFLVETADGDETRDIPAGTAYARLAGVEHNVVNRGDRPMSFIEVELKR